MSVTDPQLRSAAALVAAVPGMTCRLDLAGGARLTAGAAQDATLTGADLRELVVRGDATTEATELLTLEGIDPSTGLVAMPGARFFVSPLPAAHTTQALRDGDTVARPYLAMAKGDDELGVSVVRVARSVPAASALQTTPAHDPDLDEVALAAFSSCLVAHLIATTDAV